MRGTEDQRAAPANASEAVRAQTPTRALEPLACGNQARDFSQAMRRHSAVDGLVLPGGDAVGLVPDADVAAAAPHALVERHPGRPMLAVGAPRIGLQRLER